MRHGLIAGITTFLLLAGTGVSYAAWTAGASATTTASAASLSVATSGFDSNAFTFQNHQLATTGGVTITNTTITSSSTPATYAMTLGYTGSAALASALAVSIWSTSDTSGCASVGSLPPGTITGSWDTVAATSLPVTGNLVAGASARFCIRVTSAERGGLASSAGALSIQPSISATLTIGNWSRSATATTTQQTAWIFPAFGPYTTAWYQIRNLGTGNCVDVHAAAGSSGTGVIDYGCKAGNSSADYNQQWSFTRTSGDYYDLTPRHAQTLRLDVVGGSVTALAAVDVQTNDDARSSQEWQLQKAAANSYQLVNRLSGLCLATNDTSVYTSDVEYAQAVCDGTIGQRFALVYKDGGLPPLTLGCSQSGSGVSYSLSAAAVDTYQFEATPVPATTWVGIGDAPLGANSFDIAPGALGAADGQYTVRALWLGNELATSSVWKTTSGATTTLSCSPPPVLGCAETGNGRNRTVMFSFTPAAPESFRLQVNTSGATWSDMMSGSLFAGSGSVTITGDPPFDLAVGSYPVRAVAVGGSVIGTSSLVVNATGGYSYLRCS